MKRPVVTILIGYLLGILGRQYLVKISIISLFLLVIWILLKSKTKKQIRHYQKIIVNKLATILIIVTALYAGIIVSKLEKEYANFQKEGNINLVAVVHSSAKQKGSFYQYCIQIEEINGIKIKKKRDVFLVTKKENLQYGNQIEIKQGSYEKPQKQRNKNGFDESRYQKTKQIFGTVKGNAITIQKKEKGNKLVIGIHKIVVRIKKIIKQIIPQEERGIFFAMLLGDDSELEDTVKEEFQISSLAHILAISGMHVSYVMLGVNFFFLKVPISKKIKQGITIIFLVIFLIATGETTSGTRAVIMAIMAILAKIIHRKNDLITSMSMALLIILIKNPYAIWDVGMLLSFLGTIGILAYQDRKKKSSTSIIVSKKVKLLKIKEWFKENTMISLYAQIFLLPIVLCFFHKISTYFLLSAIIAGILITPIMKIGAVTILVASFSLKLGQIVGVLETSLLYCLGKCVNFIANLPGAEKMVITPTSLEILVYYLLLLVLWKIKKIKAKKQKRRYEKKLLTFVENLQCKQKKNQKMLIIGLAVCSCIFLLYSKMPKELEIDFIDVGQGDSTFIITPNNKKILIDGGGKSGQSSFEVGKDVVVPFLLNKRILIIDYVMISHFDTDDSTS